MVTSLAGTTQETWKIASANINKELKLTMAANKFIAPTASFSEKMQKEQEFFSKPFLMSYSGLNRLMFSPALFYNHYILGQREDVTDRNMIEGSLIHCLLLKPESFDDQFVLSVADLPSDNPRTVLHTLFNHYKEIKQSDPEDKREELHEFAYAIIDILADMNLYQSLKTDIQRLDKMMIEKNVHYWEYLKKAEGRIVIDQDLYDFAAAAVEKIKNTPSVIDAMGFFEDPAFTGVTKQNELQLTMFDDTLKFGLRGIIDNLVIDPKKKIIKVNDLKKTSKDLLSFKDSIEYYRYYLQAAMYHKLVEHVYLSRPEYEDFKIVFRFVVVDSYMQIAPIKVSEETMTEWLKILNEKLEHANYHFTTQNFELPYDFLIQSEVTL